MCFKRRRTVNIVIEPVQFLPRFLQPWYPLRRVYVDLIGGRLCAQPQPLLHHYVMAAAVTYTVAINNRLGIVIKPRLTINNSTT